MKPCFIPGIVCALALLAGGCGPAQTIPPAAPPAPPPPQNNDPRNKIPPGYIPTLDRTDAMIDLKEIGTYYQLHQVDGEAAREGVLKEVQHVNPNLYKAIQDGRYVLLKGDPSPGNAVLAYEKDAPTKGGIVLLGFVPQRMNVQEFQAAPKAGQP